MQEVFRWEIPNMNWKKLFLIGLTLLFYTSIIERSHLTRNAGPIISCMLTGALLGLLLPQTKFSLTVSVIYNLIIFIPITTHFSYQFFPPFPSTIPYWQFVEILNIRLFAALQAISSGFNKFLLIRQPLSERNLFFFWGLVSWQVSFWLVWKSIKDNNAFTAILPIGMVIVTLMQISGQKVAVLVAFVILVLLFLSSSFAEKIKSDWDRDSIPYPWDFGLDWLASVVIFSLLVGFLSFTLYLGGSKEGWREINEFIDRLREPPAQVASAGDNSMDASTEQKSEINASTSDLLLRFEPPPTLTTTILKLKVNDPPPLPPEVSGDIRKNYYLRSDIYSTYTGFGWLPVDASSVVTFPDADPGLPPAGRYYLQQEYLILALNWSQLFAVNQPFWVSENVVVYSSQETDAYLINSTQNAYRVDSWATQVSAADLANAGIDYPPSILSLYTQLPESLPARVTAFARTLTSGSASPYQSAVQVQNYLRSSYPYTLEVAPPPAGRDVVDYFLFEEKQGFCSYYATAMTVLLRSQGIPARVVTGYATNNYNFTEHAYIVTASSAHAWVEVYFPGYGWVEFEPTAFQPSLDYGPIFATDSNLQGSQTSLENVSRVTNQDKLIAIFLGLILIGTSYWLYANTKAKQSIQQVSATQQYFRIRTFLDNLGYTAPASLTPLEYANQFLPQLILWPWLQKLLKSATRLYIIESYSANPPNKDLLLEHAKNWKKSGAARIKLYFHFFIKKFSRTQ